MARAGLSGVLILAAGLARAAPVDIEVMNVRAGTGHVRVAICSQGEYTKDHCEYAISAPARQGVTVVHFPDIPAGTWAAQGYYDEHDWGELRRTFIGVPEEGVGFSNNARINLAAPAWKESSFAVGTAPVHVQMTLQYF